MDTSALLGLAQEALLLMIFASLPPIGVSLLVGVVMSVLQASTQIQETTLSVVPKLCAAVASLVVAGPWIGGQLTRFTSQLFTVLAQVSL